MKCLLLADNRTELLATLEPVLKHWCYRVLSANCAEQATAFLKAESSPCLLIIGQQVLTDGALVLGKALEAQIVRRQLPLIMLKQEVDQPPPFEPSETLAVPVDIFALFSFIQKHVEKHPRQNLRLPVRLPGMYRTVKGDYHLADILSLSTNGLFLRSSMPLTAGDRLTVVFPLLGHCRELEIDAVVRYTVRPDVSNNFLQGFGVSFSQLSKEELDSLEKFMKAHFLRQVSSASTGVGDFSAQQLKR